MPDQPQITIAVPSYNQGRFLDKALSSIFTQEVPVEVYVLDGGSTDNSVEVIRKWESYLAGWRSHPDQGQSAAINEGIAKGKADFVCWLNSDDWFLPGSLASLLETLNKAPSAPAAYGKAWNFLEKDQSSHPVWVEAFNVRRLALRCIIAQPATLIRRSAWETIGGLNESLHMAMDYDLWWRLFKTFGPLQFLDEFVAVNREHDLTKTKNNRRLHYKEAMQIVKKYNGSLPLKWWLAQPYKVWFQSIIK
ncbi:glycosyltransferase [Legionella nautarum]|uniref:Glycosyltransferase n=1 Tax=Legionella nautarum TaxID=45070 RepID=A0A0W0WVU2_9GAMM|nr:glycosyltransferase family 2 protein [Legionella nautarum]KTD36434.1 glycosyltransferase [Legionella nautarum]